MTEERSLVANLVPKLDDEALNSMMAQLNESLTSTVQVVTEVTENTQPQVQETPTTAETDSTDQRTQEILDTINTEMQEVNQALQDIDKTLQDIDKTQVDLLDAYDSSTEVTENTQPQVQETPTTAETDGADQRTQEILDSIHQEMQDVGQTLQDIDKTQVDLLDAYDSSTEVTENTQPQVQETPTTAETDSTDQRTQEILDAVNTEMQEVNQTLQDIEEIQVDLLDAYDSATVVTEDGEKEQKGFWDKLLSGDKEKGEGLSDLKGNIMAGLGVIRMVFGILDEFIRKFRRSSPLLDNVLSLIENAWNLIMAPIMTAIGIELIPLVETIYEKVFKIVQTMWEVYESEGIVGMIMVAIDGAFDIFCAIIEKVLEMFMGKETLDNIKGFVNSITKWMPEGLTFSSLIKDVISSVGKLFNPLAGSNNSAMDLNNMFWQGIDWLTSLGKGAEGGYVEASPTGTPMILGEAGEREYIIPESKVTSFANQYTTYRPTTNGNTINVYVNGYTDSDLGDKIITVLNTRTELSNLRGGF